MSIDEEGIRLAAQKAHRDLPQEVREKVHVDDILQVLRSLSIKSVEEAKATRSTSFLIAVGCAAIAFIIGMGIDTRLAAVVGLAGWFLGYRIAENMAEKKVQESYQAAVIKELGELVIARIKAGA